MSDKKRLSHKSNCEIYDPIGICTCDLGYRQKLHDLEQQLSDAREQHEKEKSAYVETVNQLTEKLEHSERIKESLRNSAKSLEQDIFIMSQELVQYEETLEASKAEAIKRGLVDLDNFFVNKINAETGCSIDARNRRNALFQFRQLVDEYFHSIEEGKEDA